MDERLKGKNAVVTGGAGGIGSHVCLALAAAGANVVVSDVGAARDGSGCSTAPVDLVVDEIKRRGGAAIANYESISDFAAAERLIGACVDSFGSIDILVNLHGNLRDRMIWNMSADEWNAVISVHLTGTFNTCRHACLKMREQKYGRIVNVTSAAWLGTLGHANYGAAKGGVVSLTKAIALEMGKYGVTANCFAPIAATRMTLTDEVKASMQRRVEQGLITQQQAEQQLKSMPKPEQVAPLVVFLASDGAVNFSGRVFLVEGGKVGLYSEPTPEKVAVKTEEEGVWTVEALEQFFAETVPAGHMNVAPREPGS